MCGIAGFMNFAGEAADPARIQAMSRAIAHRGPDGDGVWVEGPVGLGHRRLAVLDLSSAAAQPMFSACGRYVLSYNGEIYNYKDISRELNARGVRFRSSGDTEVVLEAIAAWGEGALSRFNGMFAIACFDRHEKRMLLARDRYGIKPLYFAQHADTFLFGSEIKALLAHGALSPEIDYHGLAEYLTFQNFFSERTLFRGVSLLAPGTYASISTNGTFEQRRYWDFNFGDYDGRDIDAIVKDLDLRFQEAVSRQLISDVPLGCYLSGGMDTGSITALAARQRKDMCSFTVGFDLTSASGLELGFDERDVAERLSYLNRTEHYEMVLKAGDMERCMQRLVWHLEEPRVGQSYPNFYAAKLASRFGKVALSGAGGDELFAGYPWRYYRAVRSSSFEHFIDDYYDFWQRLIPNDEFSAVTDPISSHIKDFDRREAFKAVFVDPPSNLSSPADYVNQSLYFEAKTFMHGVLVMEDKLSMAHGLETRVPFLDNGLVDLATGIPVQHKLKNLAELVRLDENEPGSKQARFFARSSDGKLVMRRLMRRYVPEDIVEGQKRGFSGPDASWFRGESIDYVRRRLMTPQARLWDYLDRDTTQRMISDHLGGQANRRLLIWSLLYLEEFLEQFMGPGLREKLLAGADP